MSILKSSAEDLILNADGSGNDIKFQSNGSEVGSLTAEGVLTATSFAGSGASLTGVGGDLSFGGDTFGADKTIGCNDAYALSLETNGNVAMKIDSAGQITQPLQPAFLVNRDGTALSTSGGTDVVWTNERFDQNADMGSTSFTAPVTGRYWLCCSVMHAITDGDVNHSIEFHISNVNIYSTINSMASFTDANCSYFSRQMSAFVDMDASDTAKAHVNLSSQDLSGNVGYTWFAGYLVC